MGPGYYHLPSCQLTEMTQDLIHKNLKQFQESDWPATCRSLTCVIFIHAKAKSMYYCLEKQFYTSYVRICLMNRTGMYLQLPLWQWGASNVYLLVLSS